MRSAIARVTIKIIELLGCIACFITKVITDLEARRVFIRNQKFSREWSLVHNVTWTNAGNTFANITYGGFSLITTLMLISRCIDANTRPSLIEKIFLIVGMLCFFAMGGIVLAAFDQVPWELHDNSIILGCLSFFVALIMLYDLSDPIARLVTDMTQTDREMQTNVDHTTTTTTTTSTHPPPSPAAATNNQLNSHQSSHPSVSVHESNIQHTNQQHNNETINSTVDIHIQPIHEKQIAKAQTQRSSRATMTYDTMIDVHDLAKHGNYHRSDSVDIVQTQRLPQAEQPVFERVLMPEKKRPTIQRASETRSSAIVQNISVDEYDANRSPRPDYLDANYNQLSKPRDNVQRHSYQHQYQPNIDHAPYIKPVHSMQHTTNSRSSDNFAYEEYDDHSDYPPPKYITKSTNTSRQMETNRYNDPARDHYTVPHASYQKQPMMVIRTYPASTTTATTITPANNAIYSNKQHSPDNNNYYHNHPHHYHHRQQQPTAKQSNHHYPANASSSLRRTGVFHAGTGAPKNSFGGPLEDDDDDVMDYRKLNATNHRSGFVKNSAAMWDRRATQTTTEFNTIV